MKRAVHARRHIVKDGKPATVAEPWCGAKSSKTDARDRVTCQRCVRLITKRTWIVE